MNKLTYIDDCQLDQFILRKILSRYGMPCELSCSDTVEEVLIQLRRQSAHGDCLPDIILLDIYDPFLNAWEFLDRLQGMYPFLAKPVEVFILSASKYPTDVERLKQYDFVKAYIVKPITKEVLVQLIREKETPMDRLVTLEAQN